MHSILTPANFFLSQSFHALMERGAFLAASDRVLEMAVFADEGSELQTELLGLAEDVERGYRSDLGWDMDPTILLYRAIYKILVEELGAIAALNSERDFVYGFLHHRYQHVNTCFGYLTIRKADELRGWEATIRNCPDWGPKVITTNRRLKDLWVTISGISDEPLHRLIDSVVNRRR